MCEARIYLNDGVEDKQIFQDVVSVEPDGDTWVCVSVLGERKLVRGALQKIDFLKHTVHFDRTPDSIND